MSRAFLLRRPFSGRGPAVWSALALLTLAACSSGGGSGGSSGYSAVGPSGTAAEARSDQETRAACRARVNEMYDRRDRADIYVPNPSVNTPQSANYLSGVPNRGLAAQFDYERTVNECARNSGTGIDRIETPMAAPPAPRVR